MWAARLMSYLPGRPTASPVQSGAAATSRTHLLGAESGPSYSQEGWSQFFSRHFRSDAFNVPGQSGKIDNPDFHAHKEDYVKQLKDNVKGSRHIRVPFHDLPECRADQLSTHMGIKVGVRPKHVSLFLTKLTLDTLCAALQEDAGLEKTVHIDFGQKSAEEASAPHVGGSTTDRAGFFTLPFKDILLAMAHFGARSDQGGAVNIEGLHVTADLSGLKIEDPDELLELRNLTLRSTVAGVHIDLSLIAPHYQDEAWRNMATLLSDANAKNLRELTLNVPMQNPGSTSYAAEKLSEALCAPGCHLASLNLRGGNWTEEVKAMLANTVKTREDMGRPIMLTLDGQQLSRPVQE